MSIEILNYWRFLMRDIDYGTVRIKLNELIEQQGISKNRLAHRAEMQRTQLNQYCNGEVTRLDIAVLARLCCALDCKVEDCWSMFHRNRNKFYKEIKETSG